LKRAEREALLQFEKSVAATRTLAALGSRCGLHSLFGGAVQLLEDASSSLIILLFFHVISSVCIEHGFITAVTDSSAQSTCSM